MYLLKPRKAALLNSLVLILIGIISYYYNSISVTALIPVFLGVPIFLCYIFYEKNNKVFAHIGMTFMLLAFVGLFKPIMGSITRSDIYATLRIGLMQLVSLYSMVCFITSFIEARKNNN
ncbi:MAG: hypothetical protein CMG66_02615 [Candidatus Marinimicrobia bacterium]|nr:hypothetical protein [Candidatus Neomarinimicrobiota bacterium]|tara:strand:- start:9635 stop:9991 length:357 start_codon:yes stop_codon:yes gene_type:complete